MKFRIVEAPESDLLNEGKMMSLEDAAVFLEETQEDLYGRAYLAESITKDGYKLEVLKDGEE